MEPTDDLASTNSSLHLTAATTTGARAAAIPCLLATGTRLCARAPWRWSRPFCSWPTASCAVNGLRRFLSGAHSSRRCCPRKVVHMKQYRWALG